MPVSAEVRLLGPVEVEVAGRRVVLERRQERCLLAVLLLEHGRVISVDRLGDLLWDGEPPERFRSLLHTQVSRVRAALRTAGVEDWVSSSRGGYLAQVPADCVDVDRFRDLVQRARSARFPGERAELLRAGLELWRGPALAGIGSDRLRQRLCAELDESRLLVTEEWLASWLESGRYADAVGELARLVGEHPLRERLVELYMRALAGSGRQADALHVYEECRTRLAEETGLDPGPGLLRAYLQVLRGELLDQGVPKGAGAAAAAGPLGGGDAHRAGSSGAGSPSQLPCDVADFTGRVADVERIRSELSRPSGDQACGGAAGGKSAAVVISAVAGQAGIGKTALAVHVAHLVRDEYPDGQLYVNLRGAERRPVEPGEVLAQFLRALGVPGEAVPEPLEERAAMYRSLLADRRVLVVLDNAAGEPQVRDLIPGLPTAGVLITSRRRLAGLPGVSVLSLDVLDDAQALDLLRRIVGAARVAAEPEAVADLVRLCAGLPLALRVVGARLAARPHWSLGRMVHRLAAEHRRLDELAYADLEVRASLALSYQGLEETDRRLLRRLALLEAPDFPGWVAAAVLDAEHEDGLAALDRLVEVHLVDVVGTDRVGQVRYRFHDLVRLYGRERCAEEEPEAERTAALARAFGGWLVLAQQARLAYLGNDYFVRLREAPRWTPAGGVGHIVERDPMEWLQAERVSLVSAIHQAGDTGLAATCWELAAVSEVLFRNGDYISDWHATAACSLAAARSAGSQLGTAVSLVRLGEALSQQYRLSAGYEIAAQAERIFSALGDRHGQANAGRTLAFIQLRYRGEWNVALTRCRDVASAFAEFEDPAGEIHALRDLARICLFRGLPDKALSSLHRADLLARQSGKPYYRAYIGHIRGLAYLDLGRYSEASQTLQAALVDVRTAGSRSGEASVLLALGRAALYGGRLPEANVLLAEALRLCREVREGTIEYQVLQAFGEFYVAQKDMPSAIGSLRDALHVIDRTRSPRAGKVLDRLAELYESSGDLAAAQEAKKEAARVKAEVLTRGEPAVAGLEGGNTPPTQG